MVGLNFRGIKIVTLEMTLKQILTVIFISQAIFLFGQENRVRASIKVGFALANFSQTKKNKVFNYLYGYNFGFSIDNNYKKNRKATSSSELLFIQKGGYNQVEVPTVDKFGQIIGIGSETFPVKLSYLSLSYGVKLKVFNLVYLRIAPRLDYLLNFKSKPYFYVDTRIKKDFYMFTGGLSYSLGILRFKKLRGLFLEFQGQNDFLKSGDKKSIGKFYNNYYGINIGFHIAGEDSRND